MALNNVYRAVDKELKFSDAQAVTVTTAVYSTTELDLGGSGMGYGTPAQVVVQVTGISATAASTILVEVAAATTTAPTVIVQDIGTVVTGSASFEKIFFLPVDVARYVRLRYTLTGTAASSATVTAFVTGEIRG